MIERSIKTIFWDIPEPEYRKDPALSQSTISAFARGGFESLKTLFEHVESPSFTFGSAVDTLITDGEKAFADRFLVSDMPSISTTAEPIVKEVFRQFQDSYTKLDDIPQSDLMPILSQMGWKSSTNWGVDAKHKNFLKESSQYYQTLFMAKGKTILPQDTYNRIFACVRALKDSPQTKNYFRADDPFEDIERVYQMKFKGVINGITYRGMADLLIVDHKNKVVIPCDLKTSHNREYNFPKSLIEFRYDIQARLYWKLIRQTMDRDEYFKDFKLEDFRFIVVNNFDVPVPLVWLFPKTKAEGTIELGGRKLRAPEAIGEELTRYLKQEPQVPFGIELTKPNNIEKWFEDRQ